MCKFIKDLPYKMIIAIHKMVKIFLSKKFLNFILFIITLGAIAVLGIGWLPTLLIENIKPEVIGTKDEATYYCAIITSLVTILGIWLTLKENRKQVEEQDKKNQQVMAMERKLSVMPKLVFTDTCIKPTKDNVIISIYFMNNQISIYADFPCEEEKINKQNACYKRCSVTNSGVGACLALTIEVENKKTHGSISNINLLQNESITLELIAEDVMCLDYYYKMKFTYYDIYGNKNENFHIDNRMDDLYLIQHCKNTKKFTISRLLEYNL
ncbi:hypothetical protein [Aminipila terrae]|uniref:Uncharacterized protein n=1 Tax=Aminipila terrae TaxID=2697030 RepID=A0A6P1MG19_9FIRM|nr:hypothetical protein [Aminipila terrae]QHI72681.1 hypothetical protein Ami3637_09970 [Aminipila terrae]